MMNDRVVVITGASSGIGLGLAKRLFDAGFKVGMLARRVDAMEQAVLAWGNAQGRVVIVECDVSKQSSVQGAIEACVSRLGPVDIFVANAGIGETNPGVELDSDVYRRLYDVNVFGALYGFEAVLPEMIARGSGQLVGISSLAAFRGMPNTGPYCSSKAALSSLLESLRVDLKGKGISVTTIQPGFVKTPLTDRNGFPMPFLMALDDGVEVIFRSILKRRKVVTFPRMMALIMFFVRILPCWVFDLLFVGRSYRKATE